MNKNLKIKIKEALSTVSPIIIIMIFLSVMLQLDTSVLMLFITGAFMVILGMGLFTMGTDMAMIPMGEYMGRHLIKLKNVVITLIICFIIGFIVTVAEPDLSVLAYQVSSNFPWMIIITISLGVGIFVLIAVARMYLHIELKYLLLFFYIIIFILAIFTSKNYLALAFDSGGVTTGAITVPFILSLCKGISSVRSDKNSHEDSFGMVGLASVGPIISILILGILKKEAPIISMPGELSTDVLTNTRTLFTLFGENLQDYCREVAVALLPIIICCIFFQVFFIKMSKKELGKIIIGLLFTYAGLLLFLIGVNVGFLPVGNLMGKELVQLEFNWILIPLGIVIGYFIVLAEPAVHVLKNQVEEITSGAISKHAISVGLSIGVAMSVGLAMIRVITGLSIWFIIMPGYLIALLLMFFCPPIFTGIAFDSGGVASGPMTVTFLLPFAMGACSMIEGGDILNDAFGIVSFVAMTPLITIQLMGIVYKIKIDKHNKKLLSDNADREIIEL